MGKISLVDGLDFFRLEGRFADDEGVAIVRKTERGSARHRVKEEGLAASRCEMYETGKKESDKGRESKEIVRTE